MTSLQFLGFSGGRSAFLLRASAVPVCSLSSAIPGHASGVLQSFCRAFALRICDSECQQ
jgi:hypothetical protein